jgi:hypothetical protein
MVNGLGYWLFGSPHEVLHSPGRTIVIRTLFICRDGSIIDDGSLSSGGECCVAVDDRRFLSITTVHARQIFMEVSDAELAAYIQPIAEAWACLEDVVGSPEGQP